MPDKIRSGAPPRLAAHCFPDFTTSGRPAPGTARECPPGFRRVALTELTGGEPTGSSPAEDARAAAEAEQRRILADRRQREEQVRREGYETGRADGLAEYRQQVEAMRQRLGAALEELADTRAALHRAAEETAVRLALALTRKLAGHLANVDDDLVRHSVSRALAKVSDQQRIVVRVHPDDHGALERCREQWRTAVEHPDGLHLEADAAVGRGGCLIETGLGEIDATLECQIDRLETLFRHELHPGGPSVPGGDS